MRPNKSINMRSAGAENAGGHTHRSRNSLGSQSQASNFKAAARSGRQAIGMRAITQLLYSYAFAIRALIYFVS